MMFSNIYKLKDEGVKENQYIKEYVKFTKEGLQYKSMLEKTTEE